MFSIRVFLVSVWQINREEFSRGENILKKQWNWESDFKLVFHLLFLLSRTQQTRYFQFGTSPHLHAIYSRFTETISLSTEYISYTKHVWANGFTTLTLVRAEQAKTSAFLSRCIMGKWKLLCVSGAHRP